MKDVISHLEKDVKMKQSREEAIRAMLNEREPGKVPIATSVTASSREELFLQ
jgi:hypothetical protein